MQAKHVRPESPYTVSIPMQVKYCTQRAYQRLWNDKTSTVTTIVGQIIMALIIGSIFYGTRNDTSSFFQKGGVLFFAVLLNALIAISEINTLYSQRPIVEKQASYAFYHPFTEAMAGIVADIPVKFAIATCFNIILYFLAGLRREPSQFFIFFLFNFVAILTVSFIPVMTLFPLTHIHTDVPNLSEYCSGNQDCIPGSCHRWCCYASYRHLYWLRQ
jgi:ATP-binding cassette subfamily G (WHITE) protein 2 (PDR)